MGAHHGSKASHGFAEDTCACVCDLVFIIPLQAARRAMAAVVGFSIYQKNPGRPA